MEKIKLNHPKKIKEFIRKNKLTNIVVETGNENIYIPNENKFIITNNFLTDESCVFSVCPKLETINLENFDFCEINTINSWFHSCHSLKEIIFPVEANIANLESLRGCFAQTAMRSIDLSFIQAKYRPVDFQYTFWESQVEKITLPRCEIHNIQQGFSDCVNLEEIIAHVTFKYSDNWMFYKMCDNCPNLKKKLICLMVELTTICL